MTGRSAGLVEGRQTPLPPLPSPGLVAGRVEGLVAGLFAGLVAGLVEGLFEGRDELLPPVDGLLADGADGRLTEGLLDEGGRENELPLLPPEGLE